MDSDSGVPIERVDYFPVLIGIEILIIVVTVAILIYGGKN